jgi:hypothetical protein
MTLDLLAGIPVTGYAAALPWHERFFGGRPSFLPTETEAAWEVAEHRYASLAQEPGRAGNALVLSFVGDPDDRVAAIAQRGIAPARHEAYGNGTAKVTCRDADGNETSLGAQRAEAPPAPAPVSRQPSSRAKTPAPEPQAASDAPSPAGTHSCHEPGRRPLRIGISAVQERHAWPTRTHDEQAAKRLPTRGSCQCC